ncbi:MAG: RluA family pseudouridine synthase [Saprospiraceae bacterium]|nr:RluA family pseudouridine synthase [Saprospiraceae bacterium]
MSRKKSRWEIVFEDDDLILINKPAGLLTIPDRYDPLKENLYKSLLSYREKIYINHRLDRDTSGLILFSKNEETHAAMQKQFEKGEIHKEYLALVHGTPGTKQGTIESRLAMNPSKKRMEVNPKGKEAITHFSVISEWNFHSLIRLIIETGKTHQIRIHMKSIACPLLCDHLYGDGKGFYLSSIKRNFNRSANVEERPLISRTALHAEKIRFNHPATGQELEFIQSVPKDMKAVIHQLSKWSSPAF